MARLAEAAPGVLRLIDQVAVVDVDAFQAGQLRAFGGSVGRDTLNLQEINDDALECCSGEPTRSAQRIGPGGFELVGGLLEQGVHLAPARMSATSFLVL